MSDGRTGTSPRGPSYALAVLTHGAGTTLPSALKSFRENVEPGPAEVVVFADAADDLAATVGAVRGVFPALEDPLVAATHPSRQVGFCGATGRLWASTVEACEAQDLDYVFWLEHDFLITRRVDVAQLAAILDSRPDIAQIALVRNAVNDLERVAGGLVASRPGQFALEQEEIDGLVVEWLVHRSYLTTNPSLMRRSFMEKNPWPDYDVECEGRFAIDLTGIGYRFAAWGDGTPWCEHVGVRDETGRGY